ncbi:MAG: protein-disulfide reductase DsbD family protein, partial [Desulfococcaceae bacterium]
TSGGSFFTTPTQETVENPFEVTVDTLPEALPPGGAGILQVRFSIAPGYELYADKTSVDVETVPGIEFGPVNHPTAAEKTGPEGESYRAYTDQARFEIPIRVAPGAQGEDISIPLKVNYQGCSQTGCFLPEEKQLTARLRILPGTAPGLDAGISGGGAAVEPEAGSNPFRQTAARFGIIGVLAAAFVWGLLTSLTPCVYPMIPVTVSVIGATNAGSVYRGFLMALLYVLGMSLTYAAFGVTAAWTGGLFGAYADHPVVRIVVAAVFVLLAFSMFDIIRIQVPAWMSTKLGGYAGAGGIGVFLTGAAAGAVVGPCVGPMLVGLLVYIAAIGDKLQGFLIMWSFALGMGMLFLVIGAFSGAAAALPRSGVWMVRLKQFFGVLMLGVALYYIRPLIPGPVFTLILGAFLIGVGIFAGALDRMDTDAGGVDRLQKAVAVLLLTLGIVYAARFAIGDRLMSVSNYGNQEAVAGIHWLVDEAEALSMAEAQNKPLMIEFRADWCAACRKMEKETLRDARVIEMAEHFVPLKLDFTETADPVVENLRQKYSIIGLPTLLFADASGRVLTEQTITEFVPAEVLVARMNQVRSRL